MTEDRELSIAEIKAVLRAARNARKEIGELDGRIKEAKEKLYHCTTRIKPEGTNKASGSGKDDMYINTIEYKQLIENYRDKRFKELNNALQLIGLLNDGRLVRMMMLYYIDGFTWEKTAEIINMSEYWVRTKLHSKALNEIKKQTEKAP